MVFLAEDASKWRNPVSELTYFVTISTLFFPVDSVSPVTETTTQRLTDYLCFVFFLSLSLDKAGYQQVVTKIPDKKHQYDIDKVADGLAAQSIASAYPNGVMGTLSLMAGLVWYLVNKSATPVIKMRQNSGGYFDNSEEDSSTQTAINQLADYWLGTLKQTDCQQRAVCELVSQSSWLSSATRWSQSAYRLVNSSVQLNRHSQPLYSVNS